MSGFAKILAWSCLYLVKILLTRHVLDHTKHFLKVYAKKLYSKVNVWFCSFFVKILPRSCKDELADNLPKILSRFCQYFILHFWKKLILHGCSQDLVWSCLWVKFLHTSVCLRFYCQDWKKNHAGCCQDLCKILSRSCKDQIVQELPRSCQDLAKISYSTFEKNRCRMLARSC